MKHGQPQWPIKQPFYMYTINGHVRHFYNKRTYSQFKLHGIHVHVTTRLVNQHPLTAIQLLVHVHVASIEELRWSLRWPWRSRVNPVRLLPLFCIVTVPRIVVTPQGRAHVSLATPTYLVSSCKFH